MRVSRTRALQGQRLTVGLRASQRVTTRSRRSDGSSGSSDTTNVLHDYSYDLDGEGEYLEGEYYFKLYIPPEVISNTPSMPEGMLGDIGRLVSYLGPVQRGSIEWEVYAKLSVPWMNGPGRKKRILVRAGNMLRLPNGDVLWPSYASIVLGQLFPLRQFRLVQVSLRELVLEVVATRPLLPDEERRLRSLVLDTLGYAFDLTIVHLETIARSPSGKFEDFVCRVDRAE